MVQGSTAIALIVREYYTKQHVVPKMPEDYLVTQEKVRVKHATYSHFLQGIGDLAGNVWELASSQYQPYPYNVKDNRENSENDKTHRVLRGASWNNNRNHARATSISWRSTVYHTAAR